MVKINILMIVNVILSCRIMELLIVDTTTELIDYDYEHSVLNVCGKTPAKGVIWNGEYDF